MSDASNPARMHTYTPATEDLAQQVIGYALERMRMDPPPLDAPRSPADLAASIGATVTPGGLGGAEALRLWIDDLAPACVSENHPRALSFVPTAPTEAATMFELVVGASSIYGASWLEGSGAVYAENQALRWIADLAGLPAGAGGCFVSGGSAGNLSALVVARETAKRRSAATPARRRVAVTDQSHSSIVNALRIIDVDPFIVPTEDDRMTGGTLR